MNKYGSKREIINEIEENEKSNMIKLENQDAIYSKKDNHIFKEKTKHLIKSALYGLLFGFTGFILLMEFLKTKNIIYIIISIMMFLVTLLLLSPFFEGFILKKQKKIISKSVKNMLTEEIYNKLKKLHIGELDIIFFERENIDAGQHGFRYDNLHDKIIDEWPGNEYVIIGYDSTAGCGPDPYIMKTDEKELPIYWLNTDGGNWKNPNKIANSFNDFIKIIACINENLNLENELNKELILNEIAKINSNKNMEYWNMLLTHLPTHLDF